MAEGDLFSRFGRTFDTGAVLFREDEPGDTMFVIQQGQVRISKAARGEDKTLAVLGPGEFFGEMAILNARPRNATAEAVSPLRVLVLDKRTFGAMIVGNAEIAVRLITKLSRRLDAANALIEVLMHRDPKSRVVLGLLRQMDMAGRVNDDGSTFVPVDARELATEINATDAETEEVFARLRRLRIVADGEGGLVIADRAKLQQFLDFLASRPAGGS